MSTIRLAVNEQLEDVLTYLEKEYRPMTRAEILKMGLSELLNKTRQREIEILDEISSKELAKAIKEIESGQYKSFSNVQDLIKDLNK